MSSAFIQALNTHTLCTWYILPLIGLNKYNFQDANFIDSFVTRDGNFLVVEVRDWNLCPGVSSHKQFLKREEREECDRLIFNIPTVWGDDMECFLRGTYSKMSDYAKQIIRESSGLQYGYIDPQGKKKTDAILLALDRSPVLREQWIRELTTPYKMGPDIPEDLELLSLPQERIFTEVHI